MERKKKVIEKMKECKMKKCGYWIQKDDKIKDTLCKHLKIKDFTPSCRINKKTKIREYSLGQEFCKEEMEQ